MTSDLQTDVLAASRAGFTALEVWAKKIDRYLEDHSLESLDNLLTDHKVLPLAINSIEFIAFRGGDFSKIEHRLHALGQIARAIHCPTVVVVPSPSPGKDIQWSEVVKEYVHVLRRLSDIAGEYQVRLSFEFLGFGWCSVRTPRAAAEILKAVDRENVGMTIDAAHFYAGGGLLGEINLLDPKDIFLFHLDDLEDAPKEALHDGMRLLPGLGVVPLQEICLRLRDIGYDGPCSIELFRPEYWQRDPFHLADQSRQAAVNVLSPFFELK
jgi:2-keto-myo-inositol isomerase